MILFRMYMEKVKKVEKVERVESLDFLTIDCWCEGLDKVVEFDLN